jgi:ribosomal protein S18 acetylase RimI-like enzyme
VATEGGSGRVRAARADDVERMLDLAEQRRQLLAGAPGRFSRPAQGARELQRPFFGRLVEEERFLVLVHEGAHGVDGFLVGLHGVPPPPLAREGPDCLHVDDFALAGDALWPGAGAALLEEVRVRAAARGARLVVVVVRTEEGGKRELVERLGLRPAGEWWVRRIEPQPAEGEADGRGGLLVGPARPVYERGGPVALADAVDGPAGLDELERTAAARGAALVVVPVAADAEALRAELGRRGYEVVSEWHAAPADALAG